MAIRVLRLTVKVRNVISKQASALSVIQDTGETTVNSSVISPTARTQTAIKVMVPAVHARRIFGVLSVTVHAILKNVQGFLSVQKLTDQYATIA